jgi:hypothetical protein
MHTILARLKALFASASLSEARRQRAAMFPTLGVECLEGRVLLSFSVASNTFQLQMTAPFAVSTETGTNPDSGPNSFYVRKYGDGILVGTPNPFYAAAVSSGKFQPTDSSLTVAFDSSWIVASPNRANRTLAGDTTFLFEGSYTLSSPSLITLSTAAGAVGTAGVFSINVSGSVGPSFLPIAAGTNLPSDGLTQQALVMPGTYSIALRGTIEINHRDYDEKGYFSPNAGIGFTLTVSSLPDIAVTSSGATGYTIPFDYSTTGQPGPFTVGLYESSDDKLNINPTNPFDPNPTDPAIDKWIASQTINPGDNPQGSGSFNLPSPFPNNPARPFLLVAADPANSIVETDENNNVSATRYVPPVDLVAEGGPDNLYWRSVEDGGGFSFRYRVIRREDTPIVPTTIVFAWADGSPAFIFDVDDNVDDNGTPSDAVGEHTVTVRANEFAYRPRAPTAGNDKLTMTIDPDDFVAETDESNNVTRLMLVPLVVEVVTHGFATEPPYVAFTDLAKDIVTLVTPGSVLENRVATEVSTWQSPVNVGWKLTAFAKAVFHAFRVDADNVTIEIIKKYELPEGQQNQIIGRFKDAMEEHAVLAQEASIKADQELLIAALQIIDDLNSRGLLSTDDKRLQHIELIGHSRGAQVNALVALLLSGMGYEHIDYIALDGYGPDWSYGTSAGGLASNIDIVDLMNGVPTSSRVNYQAGYGLVFDEVIADWQKDLALGAGVVTVMKANNELRAPRRFGAANDVVIANATHTTIYDNQFFGQYLEGTYVGRFANDPGSDGASGTGDEDVESLLKYASAGIGEVVANNGIDSGPHVAPTLPHLMGFVDGNIEREGALHAKHLSRTYSPLSDIPPFGDRALDELIHSEDEFLQSLSDPLTVINLYWDTAGDVRLFNQEGNTALQLVRPGTGDTSVAQSFVFPDRALSIDFDLGIQAADTGDKLQVLLDGSVLAEVALDSFPADRHVSVSLAGVSAKSGTFKFKLECAGIVATSITLDNFEIKQVANTAPSLADGDLALPTVPIAISDSANQGVFVSSLLGGVTDPDRGVLQGMAIVGVNSSLGTLQFTLNGGKTWLNVGEVSDKQALLLTPDTSTRIRLVPNGLQSGTVDNAFTFRAWDQTTGIYGMKGQLFDASKNGGTTPFSSATSNVAATVIGTVVRRAQP